MDGVEKPHKRKNKKTTTQPNTTKTTTQENNHNTKHHRALNQTTHQNQSTTHESGEKDRGLNRKFKRGVKNKGIGHWVNGVGGEKNGSIAKM